MVVQPTNTPASLLRPLPQVPKDFLLATGRGPAAAAGSSKLHLRGGQAQRRAGASPVRRLWLSQQLHLCAVRHAILQFPLSAYAPGHAMPQMDVISIEVWRQEMGGNIIRER